MKTGTVYPVKETEQTATAISNSATKLQFTVPKGSYDGTVKVASTDADFIADNIKNGVSLFGLTGNIIADGWRLGMYKGATENIYASSGYEVIIKGDKISWNGGTSWTTLNLGFIWDYYGLVMSSDGKYIYIAEDLSTTVHRSSNYGVSWTTSTILEPYNKYETPILCSDDGSTVYIGGYYGTHQYKSTDYGATFSTSYLSLSEHWQLVGSSDLTKLYKLPAGNYERQPQYSGDSGATWTSFGPSCKITNGICSSNGTCYANVYENISGGYYRFYKFIGTSSTIVSSVNDRNYLPLPDLSKVVNVEKNYSDALLSNITLTSSEEIQPISYQRQSHAKSYILVVSVAGGLGCVCFYKKGLSLFVDN